MLPLSRFAFYVQLRPKRPNCGAKPHLRLRPCLALQRASLSLPRSLIYFLCPLRSFFCQSSFCFFQLYRLLRTRSRGRQASACCTPGRTFLTQTDAVEAVGKTWAFEPVMPTFALASCSGARGRKCQTVATYRGVWPQNVSTRRHYEGREL